MTLRVIQYYISLNNHNYYLIKSNLLNKSLSGLLIRSRATLARCRNPNVVAGIPRFSSEDCHQTLLRLTCACSSDAMARSWKWSSCTTKKRRSREVNIIDSFNFIMLYYRHARLRRKLNNCSHEKNENLCRKIGFDNDN